LDIVDGFDGYFNYVQTGGDLDIVDGFDGSEFGTRRCILFGVSTAFF